MNVFLISLFKEAHLPDSKVPPRCGTVEPVTRLIIAIQLHGTFLTDVKISQHHQVFLRNTKSK